MKIAHLILAHNDSLHISRLAERLSVFSDVYIHIDKKTDISDFKQLITRANCIFITTRFNIDWGGV